MIFQKQHVLLAGGIVAIATLGLLSELPVGGQARLDGTPRQVAAAVVDPLTKVCDAVQLSGPRLATPLVVASLDGSGRGFCNGLAVVDALPTPHIVASINAWEVNSVQDILTDLNADGTPELAVPTPLSPYEGAACIAVAPIVYECDRTKCVAAGVRFEAFYLERAMELSRSISQATDHEICDVIARDKLLRLSGKEPLAGFDIATKWSTSPEPGLRLKAIAVLQDIGNISSREHLKRLSADRDILVASAARVALTKIKPPE